MTSFVCNNNVDNNNEGNIIFEHNWLFWYRIGSGIGIRFWNYGCHNGINNNDVLNWGINYSQINKRIIAIMYCIVLKKNIDENLNYQAHTLA